MMEKIKIFLILVFLLPALSLVAQKNHGLKEPEQVKLWKEAEFLVGKRSYYNATDLYQKIYKAHPENNFVGLRLADTYFVSRNYEQSIRLYSQILPGIENDKEVRLLHAKSWYQYGLALKMTGQYDAAQREFLNFIKIRTDDADLRELKKLATNQVQSCDYALEATKKHYCDHYEITLAPGAINAGYSDFSPQLTEPNTLIFASLRSDTVLTTGYEKEGKPTVQLFKSEQQSGQWQEPEVLTDFNNEFDHTANGTYSQDGNQFYFTRCYETADKETICSIYFSEKTKKGWQKPVKMSRKVNARNSTNTQPAFGGTITRRRKKYDVLYFVSDRVRGKGGKDIWFALIDESGKVQPAENCGAYINTAGDEVTPYYDTDNQKLYFSSDFHFGFGGLDVIKAEGNLKNWMEVENMGLPINSTYDDTYYSFQPKFRKGTLVSNRPGGLSLQSETCCDDIYMVNPIPVGVIRGIVLEKDSAELPIAATQVGYDLKQDSLTTSTQWIAQSDKQGEFWVEHQIGKKQFLVLNKEKYQKAWVNLDTIQLKAQDTTWIKVYLDKIPEPAPVPELIVEEKDTIAENQVVVKDFNKDLDEENIKDGEVFLLKNLQFDTNKSIIREASFEELDELKEFMVSHPDISVEIAGHTDNRGKSEMNLELSQSRADAVKVYLREKGVDDYRMIAKGYGETQPVADNDTEVNRQKNRRTEVKIVGKAVKK